MEVATSISKEIDRVLQQIFGGTDGQANLRLAVRSSALGEDSAELSAAGQNETVLGVRAGGDSLMGALKKCWASLFAFQSVEYRRLYLDSYYSPIKRSKLWCLIYCHIGKMVSQFCLQWE